MTTGKPPWHQFSNQVTVLYHIACSEALPEFPEIASDELTALLKSCLQRDPARRPDITSLLLFPFVSGGSRNSLYFTQRPMTVSTDTLGGMGEMANWRASSALMSRQGTAVNQKADMRQLSPEITTTGNALVDAGGLDGPYPFIETDVSGDCDDEVAVYDGERVNESDISAFDIDNLPIRETIHGWEGSLVGSPCQTIAERRGLVISEMNLSSDKSEDINEGGSMNKQLSHIKSMSAVPVIEYSLMIPAISPTGKLGALFNYYTTQNNISSYNIRSCQQKHHKQVET
jgi:serine/threonine protein kinase